MAIILIMGFVILNMWVAFILTYRKSGVQTGRYLLGITLPANRQKEPEVLDILNHYLKKYRKILWIGFLSGMSILFLNQYISLMFPCMMLWFGLLLLFFNENVISHSRALYTLKCKKEWLAADPHIVRIDTVLSSTGEKGVFSYLWFLPAWVMGMISCLLLWQMRTEGFALIIMGLCVFLEVIFFGLYRWLKKSRPQVYCDNTLANQKLNNVVKREWSLVLVIHSYGVAVFGLMMAWAHKNAMADIFSTDMDFAFAKFVNIALLLLISSGGTFLTLFIAYRNIRKVKEQVFQSLELENAEIYGDEDEYWLYGYPADRRPPKLTEKRIGIGLTFGSSIIGGYLEKGFWILMIAFTIWFSLLFAQFDFATIDMEIEGGKCKIQAASYRYSFDLEDVEAITWVEERPYMTKMGGLDSNRFYFGDFRVKDYGRCKVYISVVQDAVIRIDTVDRTIWLNSESREQTKAFYEELLAGIQASE